MSLALDSSSAERPSKSRRLTSLPSVAPTMRAVAGHDQHHLRLRVVPGRLRMQAGIHAGADRGQHRRLGEDLGVGADADFEILAPGALRDQHLLQPHSLGRARLELRQVVADQLVISARIAAAAAGLPRARSSITRSSIEIAKVTPAALMTCRSIGASSHGLCGRGGRAACWRGWRRGRRCVAPCAAQRLRRIVLLAQRADGRKARVL